MTRRFAIHTSDDFHYVGPVRGSGGFVSSLGRMLQAVRLAEAGRPTGLYEPLPGHVAIYPKFAAHSDGDPIIVDLRHASVEAV